MLSSLYQTSEASSKEKYKYRLSWKEHCCSEFDLETIVVPSWDGYLGFKRIGVKELGFRRIGVKEENQLV